MDLPDDWYFTGDMIGDMSVDMKYLPGTFMGT